MGEPSSICIQLPFIPVQNITHLDRWIDKLICLSFSPHSSHFSNTLLRARGCEPSCFLWLPNYLRAHSAELAAREGGWYCFHDRKWLGECALILQELLSQANKCKPPCWLGCRAEPSGGQPFCVPVPKLWNHQYTPWNQSIETRFVVEGRPTSRGKRKIPNLWHI